MLLYDSKGSKKKKEINIKNVDFLQVFIVQNLHIKRSLFLGNFFSLMSLNQDSIAVVVTTSTLYW